MSSCYLLPIYEKIFDERFDYHDFNKRLKMQKAIFLLQEMGVPIGEYDFSWYKHGPYSQALLDDMHLIEAQASFHNLSTLTTDNQTAIAKLKKAIQLPKDSSYNQAKWIECIASIYYLQQNVPSMNNDKEKILDVLVKRKDHLNDATANREALKRIDFLFA